MMKLSEALRLGAMIRPQADGYFFIDGKSCAQGAALEATGTLYSANLAESGLRHAEMQERWPWIGTQWDGCPECGGLARVSGLIAHLNNQKHGAHGWTRERIADWIEGLEAVAQLVEAPAIVAAPAIREEALCLTLPT